MLLQKWVFQNMKKKIMVKLLVLGDWSGCYVVLPVLGPSTVRDTFGSFVNVLGGDPYYNVCSWK